MVNGMCNSSTIPIIFFASSDITIASPLALMVTGNYTMMIPVTTSPNLSDAGLQVQP